MKAVLQIHNGEVYKKQDLIGKGDPYVIVKIGDNEKKTQVQTNTQQPVWEERMSYLQFSC
jgi:Ca2+-dependent lipid-binding protein